MPCLAFACPKDTLERPIVSALAAQNILPILSPDEMSGHTCANDVADAVAAERVLGDGGACNILAKRLEGITEYRQRFGALGTTDIHITDNGTALSALSGRSFAPQTAPLTNIWRVKSP